jgi:hypothetical protein
MSEGQTWSSEDTRVFSFKVFLTLARGLHCVTSLPTALTAAFFSEAERIVFAAEGLLFAHTVRLRNPRVEHFEVRLK